MNSAELRERLGDLDGEWKRSGMTDERWVAAPLHLLDAVAAALERLEELDSERAEWVEAWDMMRDTILDDYGPLEINEILTTIDYHDPRQATPAPAPQQGGTDD